MKHLRQILLISVLLCSTSFMYAIAPISEPVNNAPVYPRIKANHNQTYKPNKDIYTQSKNMQAPARANNETTEEYTLPQEGLLILVQFADVKFTSGTKDDFDSLANGANYTYNGACGSAREYFRSQSKGKYVPHFNIVGPLTLNKPFAYYGTDNSASEQDRYIADFVMETCFAAHKEGVNFADYDTDGDTVVDLIYIMYAGYGQADGGPDSTIWPHAWDIESALAYNMSAQDSFYVVYDWDNDSVISERLPMLDGKYINNYACSNELKMKSGVRNGIGTLCHEFSHVLGLPDNYVTAGNASNNETPGAWSLMGYGNYVNNGNTPPNYSAYDKFYMGWNMPIRLTEYQEVTIEKGSDAAYMYSNTEEEITPYTPDTVYYFENRQYTGWDKYLPGHGLIIWRVIYDEDDWAENGPNNDIPRYTIVTASGRTPYTRSTTGGGRRDTPFPGTEDVTSVTLSEKCILSNITETNGKITFTFGTKTPTAITNTETGKEKDNRWYNILGQPVNQDTYKGIVIHKGKTYLLNSDMP